LLKLLMQPTDEISCLRQTEMLRFRVTQRSSETLFYYSHFGDKFAAIVSLEYASLF